MAVVTNPVSSQLGGAVENPAHCHRRFQTVRALSHLRNPDKHPGRLAELLTDYVHVCHKTDDPGSVLDDENGEQSFSGRLLVWM